MDIEDLDVCSVRQYVSELHQQTSMGCTRHLEDKMSIVNPYPVMAFNDATESLRHRRQPMGFSVTFNSLQMFVDIIV